MDAVDARPGTEPELGRELDFMLYRDPKAQSWGTSPAGERVPGGGPCRGSIAWEVL